MLLKLSTKHKRLIACLIFACTVFTVCSQPLTVFAVDSIDMQEQITENDVVSDYPQAEILELDVSDVPEQLNFNEAKEKQ